MKYVKEHLIRRWKDLQEQTASGAAGGNAGGSMPGARGAAYAVPLGGMLRRVFPSMGRKKRKHG